MRLRAAAALCSCLLLLLGCPTSPSDDDDDSGGCADTDPGTLHACVYWEVGDATGISGGHVLVRSDPAEEPVEALTGPDGCTDIVLAPGTWEAAGSDENSSCITPYEAHELTSCGTVEVTFYVMEWCMVGG